MPKQTNRPATESVTVMATPKRTPKHVGPDQVWVGVRSTTRGALTYHHLAALDSPRPACNTLIVDRAATLADAIEQGAAACRNCYPAAR